MQAELGPTSSYEYLLRYSRVPLRSPPETDSRMQARAVLFLLQLSVATRPSLVLSSRRDVFKGSVDLDVASCFNGTDSTECLQRGFDAAGETGQLVIVPAMPTPWIVRPLYLRRNGSHVRLAAGAIIEARRAAAGENNFYAGYGDCLLSIRRFVDDAGPPMNSWDKHKLYPTLPLKNISLSGGAGSTLRMWKQVSREAVPSAQFVLGTHGAWSQRLLVVWYRVGLHGSHTLQLYGAPARHFGRRGARPLGVHVAYRELRWRWS